MEREDELLKQIDDAILLHGESHRSVAEIYYELADLHHRRGEVVKAKELFQKSYNILIKEVGEQFEETIDSYYRLCFLLDGEDNADPDEIYKRRNHLLQLRDKFEQSTSPRIKVSDSSLGNLFMDSTMIYNDIAEEARNAGDYATADAYYVKCIQVRKTKYGQSSPAIAIILMNYSQSLQLQEKLPEAERVLKEALEINTKAYGAFHGTVAEVLNKLGLVYVRQQRFGDAEVALRESLRLRQSLFGDLNIIVGSSLNNLAELYREKKDFLTAITFHNSAIEAYEKSVGVDHPGSVNARGNLGVTYRRQAREGFEKGEQLVKEAVTYLQEHGYDANHPWVVKFDVEDAIAEAQRLLDTEEFETANELLESLIQGSSSRGGAVGYLSPSQRFIIYECKVRALLGKTRYLLWHGRYTDAGALINEGMANIIAKTVSQENPLYGQALLLIAEVKAGSGDYVGAKEGFLTAMQILTDLLGPDAVQLAEVMVSLADLSRVQALYSEAEALYTQAMHLLVAEIQRDPSPQPKPNAEAPTLYARSLLGVTELYFIKNNFEAALSTLAQTKLVCQAMTGAKRAYFASYLELQALLFQEKGELDECLACFSQAMNILKECFTSSHPSIGKLIFKQARIAYMKNQLATAEELNTRAEEILSLSLAPITEHCIAIQYLAALVMRERGQLEPSKALLVEILAKRRKIFGGRHPLVGETMSAIAECVLLRGDPADAMLVFEDAKKIHQELFDSDGWNAHKHIAAAMLGNAKCVLMNGMDNDAVPILEECVKIQNALGSRMGAEMTLELAEATLWMATTYFNLSKIDECKKLLVKTVNVFYSRIGQTSLQVASCLLLLGRVMNYYGQYRDARSLFSYCIDIRIRILGLKHCTVYQTLAIAADNIRDAGYLSDAMCLVAIALPGLAELFATSSIYYLQANLIKARILCDQRKFADAEILYREIAPGIKSFCGEMNAYFLEVTLGLAESARLQRAKIATANTKYKEALTLAGVLYGDDHSCIVDIKCALTMIVFQSQKTRDAFKQMQKDIVPLHESWYGEGHPKTLRAKGRVGLMMDEIEPGDGDRIRGKSMKYYMSNSQFFYPADHPYVIELEGYEKDMQGRTSSVLVEQGLETWSIPQSRRDVGMRLTTVFIDSLVEAAVNGSLGTWSQMDAFNLNKLEPDYRHVYLRVFDSSYEDPVLELATGLEADAETAESHPDIGSIPDMRPLDSYQSSDLMLSDTQSQLAAPSVAMEEVVGEEPAGILDDSLSVPSMAVSLMPDDAVQLTESLQSSSLGQEIVEESVPTDVGELSAAPSISSIPAESGLSPIVDRLIELVPVDDEPEDTTQSATSQPKAQRSGSITVTQPVEQYQSDLQLVAEPGPLPPDSLDVEKTTPAENLAESPPQQLQSKEGSIMDVTQAEAAGLQVKDIEEATSQLVGAEISEEKPETVVVVDAIEESTSAIAGYKTEAVVEIISVLAKEKSVELQPALITISDIAPAPEAAPEAAPAAAPIIASTSSAGSPIPVPLAITPTPAVAAPVRVIAVSIAEEPPSLPEYASLDAAAQSDLFAAKFMYSRALELTANHRHLKAFPLFEETLKVRDKCLPGQQLTIDTKFSLAKNQYKLNYWDAAIGLCQSCIEMQVALSGESCDKILPFRLLWCRVLITLGKYWEAEEMLTEIITTQRDLHPDADPFWSKVYYLHSLNLIYLDQLDRANQEAERCYNATNASFGNKGLEMTDSFMCSARVAIAVGKFNDAKPLLEQALIGRKNKLTEMHPKVADVFALLGCCLFQQGKYVNADAKFEQAEAIRGKTIIGDDFNMCEIKHYRGCIQEKLGFYAKAQEIHRENILVRTRLFGSRSLPVAESMQELAVINLDYAFFDEAKEDLVKILTIKQECCIFKSVVQTNSAVLWTNLLQGEVERRLSNYSQALGFYDIAAEGMQQLFGKESAAYATCEHAVADWLTDSGDLDKAERTYERVLKLRRIILGNDHADYAASLNSYGNCLRVHKKWDKAIILLEEALKIRRIVFHENHPLIAECINNWGLCLIGKAELASVSGKYKPKVQVDKLETIIGEESELSQPSTSIVVGDHGPGNPPISPNQQEDILSQASSLEEDSAIGAIVEEPVAMAVNPEPSDVFGTIVPTVVDEDAYYQVEYDYDDLPMFPDILYRLAETKLRDALAIFLYCFPNEEQKHPVVVNVEGNIGILQYSEFQIRDKFFIDLPKEDRKAIKAREMRIALEEGDDHVEDDSQPKMKPGVGEIMYAIQSLENYNFIDSHPWLIKFKHYLAEAGDITIVETDHAKKAFLEAEELRKQRLFEEADQLYDDSMFLLLEALGSVGAAGSIKTAEVVLAKADVARIIGRLAVAEKMYILTMSICRRAGENTGEIAAQVFYGLAELSRLKRQFEDSLPLYQQGIVICRSLIDCKQHVLFAMKIGLVRGYLELGKFVEADENLQQALRFYEAQDPPNHEDVAECNLLIGKLHLLRGEFSKAIEHIDKALGIIRTNFSDEHHTMAEIVQIRAEYKQEIGKYYDARKEIGKAISLRIRYYGSLQPYNKTSESSVATINFLHIADDLNKQEKALQIRSNATNAKNIDFWDEYETERYSQTANDEDEIDEATVLTAAIADDLVSEDPSTPKSKRFEYNPAIRYDKLFEYKKVPVTDHPLIVACLFSRGEICFQLGDYDEAKELLVGCITMANNMYGQLNLHTARAECVIGQICYFMESLDEAGKIISNSLKTRLQLISDQNPDRSVSYVALGTAKFTQCKLEECYDNFTNAYHILGKVYGENHFRVIAPLVGLADVKRCKGDFTEAGNLLARALNIAKSYYGEVHPHLAAALHCIGQNSIAQSLYDAAGSAFEQAVSIRSLLIGDDHPDTMQSIFAAAKVQRLQGNIAKFKKDIESCFAMQKKRFGKQHRDTNLTLLYLAYAYTAVCKYSTATTIFERCAFELPTFFGPDHVIVSQAYLGLAENYKLEGNFEQAKQCYTKALNTNRRIFGEKHPDVATAMHGLGEVFLMEGHLDDAIKILDDALAIRRLTLSSMHGDIAQSFHGVGWGLFVRGRYNDAYSMFQRSVSLKSPTLGPHHPETLESLIAASVTLKAMGQPEQTAANLSRYLPLLIEAHGDRHPSIARNMHLIGETATEMGLFADGYRWIKDGLDMRMQLFAAGNANHPALQESYLGLAENLRCRGCIASLIPEVTTEDSGSPQSASRKLPVDVDANLSGILDDDESIGSVRSAASSTQFSKLGTDSKPHRIERSDDDMFALPMFEKALDIAMVCYGEEHIEVVKANFGIAECLRHMGKYRDAHSKYKRVMLLSRRLLGDDHPISILTFAGLADILRVTSKIFADEAEFEEASAYKGNGPTFADQLSAAMGIQSKGVKSYWAPSATVEALKTGNMKQISAVPPALKKKKPFNVTGGYMGYCFPEPKRVSNSNIRSVTQPTKIQSSDAKWLYDYSISLFKKLFSDSTAPLQHPIYASLLYGKGELLRARRKSDKALECLEQSLDIRRRLFRGNHPAIADCLCAIAEVYRGDNRFDKAQPIYQIALEMRIEMFGPTHFAVGEVKNNIGIMLFTQGRYAEAEGLYSESMNIRINSLGPEHPAVAQSLNNLAGLLHAVGRLEEARPLYLRALDIKKSVFGTKHPDYAQALNNLGLLLKALGEVDEALEMQQAAYDIQVTTFGPVHADIATSLHNLASVFTAKGMRVKARDTYRQAVEVKRKVFGLDHPSVASSLNNLAGLLLTMNELEESRDLYEESLRIRRKVFGEMHPTVAESLNNIGLMLYSQRRYVDAQPLLEKSLTIKRTTYGPKHPIVALAIHNYAVLMHKMGRKVEAATAYQEAIEIRSELFGPDHPTTMESRRNLQLLNADKLTSKGRKATDADSFNSDSLSEGDRIEGISLRSDFDMI